MIHDFELTTCRDCYAVVRVADAQKHEAWHKALSSALYGQAR